MLKHVPEDIPGELFEESLLMTEYEDLIKICLDKDSKVYSICKQPRFWKDKLNYEILTHPDELINDLFIKSCKFGRIIFVSLLLSDSRVDPSHEDNLAIRLASLRGRTEVVKLLLTDSRVDPSAEYNYAIQYASEYGHTEVVRLLLADDRVNPSSYGNPSIQYASEYGRLEVVKLLLSDDRVDPSARDNYAIKQAAHNGHLGVVRLLLANKRVRSTLSSEDLEKYEQLIK